MKLELFSLTWMLYVQRIHTTTSFTFLGITPTDKIVIGYDINPIWSLTVRRKEVHKYYSFVDIFVYRILVCTIHIDAWFCPPSKIPKSDCYCIRKFRSSRLKIQYNLKITAVAKTYQSKRNIAIRYLNKDPGDRMIAQHIGTLPIITSITRPSFNFENGVTQKGSINVGNIWDAEGSLSITNATKFYFINFVEVLKDTEPFCFINIRDCSPRNITIGDISCYCTSQYGDVYYLRVAATAQKNQSQDILTIQIESTKTGDTLVKGTVGTLPIIKEEKITTKENSSTVQNLWLRLLSYLGVSALLSLIGGLVFWYFTKFRSKKTQIFYEESKESNSTETKKTKGTSVDPVSYSSVHLIDHQYSYTSWV